MLPMNFQSGSTSAPSQGPSTGGLRNIFAGGSLNQGSSINPSNVSPKTAQKLEEDQVGAQMDQAKADKALLAADPSKSNSLFGTANNLANIQKNLDAYDADLNTGILPRSLKDNNLGYDIQKLTGTNPILSNLNQNYGQTMVEQIKALKEAGIAPSQLMNTENEWTRQLAAKAGDGPIASRKEAFHGMTRAFKQDLISVEANRAAAAQRLGVPHTPLIDPNTLPGPKIYSFSTGDKTIGSTIIDKKSGKRYRVIAPDQVEEL
jgi:hypothetical protein